MSKIKTTYSLLSIQKRLLSFILIVTFVFLTLISRLVFLQIVDAKSMQLKALSQWVRTLPLTAKRGSITDTNGNILAISYTSYDVYIRAKEVQDGAKCAMFLSSLLGLDYETVFKKAMNKSVSESLVKLQVDEATAQKILNSNLKGLYVSENIFRHYPYGKSLCQVLGFLTSDSIGQTGVECYYEHILRGQDGKFLTQSDVRGITLDDSMKYYVEAVDGMDIKLNIDINIQTMLEDTLSLVFSEQAPKSASVIVMDPATSKILGLAINPSFDLNNVPRDNVKELLAMSKNFTVTDVYEPGSTFKILTLAAALSEGLVSMNEHFYCPGYRIVDGEKIKCWKTTGHGHQTLSECVQNSCNCCFMDLALRLGKDKLYKYLNSFGIGSSTGVDVSGESSGLLLDKDIVKTVDLVRIGFGQTVAVTQLQLLNAFCSVINGGTLNTPQLASSFYQENREVFSNKVISKNKTVSKEVGEQMLYLLEQSLSKAGDMTFVEGYKVAGKTGTAQKYGADGQISRGKYVSSFFGFLCCGGKPQYALLLCVDEPSKGAYYGSVVAKPYAKTIFEKIISYKQIPKDDKNAKTEIISVPNLVGVSITNALATLDKMGAIYEVAGEGTRVAWQFPNAGEQISKSSTILLSTE